MKGFWEEREEGALKPVLPSRQKHHWQTLECNYFPTLEPIGITKSVQLLTGSPFPTYTPYPVTAAVFMSLEQRVHTLKTPRFPIISA